MIGHERVKDYFDTVFRRGNIAHAYLFFGPEGVGKFLFAERLAQSFHCEDSRGGGVADRACGACRSCRAIRAGTHPLVSVLSRTAADEEMEKEIKLGAIQDLKHSLSFLPPGGKMRVAIVDRAERMNQEAANAFLKLLEEPGQETVIILVSAYPDLLPATICSRVQPIRFGLVSDVELRAYGKAHAPDGASIEELLRVSAGRPGVLVRFLEDAESWSKERTLLSSLAAAIRKGNAGEALRFSEKMVEDSLLRERAVEYILRILRKDLCEGMRDRMLVAEAIHSVSRAWDMASTTNTHPRLASDAILLAASAAYQAA